MIVYGTVNSPPAGVSQPMLQHHFRLALNQPHRLLVDVAVARRRISHLLGESDRVAMAFDLPFARIHELVLLDVIISISVPSNHTDFDFDKHSNDFALIPS